MDFLKDYFDSLKIEYFRVLDYRDMHVTGQEIMDRESFTPKSVIIYLLPYYTGKPHNISRYAASLDYHIAIREINDGLSKVLRERFPSASLCGYGDHSPIDERYAALVGGLGILGDNGLLINEKYGSYVFIGDLISDIPPEELSATSLSEILHCESCGKCKAACPTGILTGRGNDCLSAITQRKGELSESEAALMRRYNTAWGCDMCQCVCPHNVRPMSTPVEFFYRERIDELTHALLSEMDKKALSCRAFGWRGRQVLIRNLDIIYGENDEK